MFSVLSGMYLGWSLGANNAANVFGSAVASRMVKFWTAAVLASFFVLVGALLEGQAGIETLRSITSLTSYTAMFSSLAAALTVTIMTVCGLPISASQAVVGGIIGIGLLNNQVNGTIVVKVLTCWISTPVGGLIIGIVLHRTLAAVYNAAKMDLVKADIVLRMSLIVAGSYGAYSLGANNVANVTAVFVGAGLLTGFTASLIGGLSIGLGILTFSRPVMETVGRRLVRLDAFSALVVVLTVGVTAHIFTFVGVPVSTSHAVVGAVLAVGLVKGANTINRRTLLHIVAGWFVTPVLSCLFALLFSRAMGVS